MHMQMMHFCWLSEQVRACCWSWHECGIVCGSRLALQDIRRQQQGERVQYGFHGLGSCCRLETCGVVAIYEM